MGPVAPPAGSVAENEQRLLEFLRGAGPGPEDYTLEEVLGWDYGRLERQHDYIQWIFPTDEVSKFSSTAPVLTPDLTETAKVDENILSNMRRSLVVYLRFLGLELVTKPALRVQKSPSWKTRVQTCWVVNCLEGNHNWRRLARVLRSMRLMGLADEVDALYECLEHLYTHREIPAEAETAMRFWQVNSGRESDPFPRRAKGGCLPFPGWLTGR